MDTSGACAGVRTQLGVYLTGSVPPADRAAIVGHLATCADCRQELADLAGLPALLRRRAAMAAAQPPEDVLPETDDDGRPETGEALLGRALDRVARRRRRYHWLLAAAALVLVTAAGVGWTQRLWAPSPVEPPVSGGTVLETDRVGGVTVLTDAEGYTLYWFGPDTAARSACDAATCIQRWPPVTGPAVAGIGVTGTLGAIVRPDGSLQATYDGHPLYTASVDTGPGQARGNGIWAAGGVWHEVTVASRGMPPASGTTPAREPASTPPTAPAESYGY